MAGLERPAFPYSARVSPGKLWLLGAGPGAADLVTVRAARALADADVVIWGTAMTADALVAEHARPDAELVPWPPATTAEIHAVYDRARTEGLVVARLLWGDPAIYSSLRDEVREARARDLELEIVPGVSALCAAAAALGMELTRAPQASPSLILTAPSAPEPMHELARHGATIAVFMAGGRGEELQQELMLGGYGPDTACAVVHRVTRDGEIVVGCRLDELATTLAPQELERHTLVLVGAALGDGFGQAPAD